MDCILTLGGDGTVHEVVNGLLAEGAQPSLPVLGTVPGGSANVFARALGFPQDAVESTGLLLRAMRDGHTRTIGLGQVEDRYFTFTAGLGLDAEIMERMEQAGPRARARPHPIFGHDGPSLLHRQRPQTAGLAPASGGRGAD